MTRLLHRYGDRVDELARARAAARGATPRRWTATPPTSPPRSCTPAPTRAPLHLDDVLERRTRLAITRADRGLGVAGEVAALMAQALGWSEERTARELAAYATPRGGCAGRRGRSPTTRVRWPPTARCCGARGRAGAHAVTGLILGLDQGTSSTRCLALDPTSWCAAARRWPWRRRFPPRVGGAGPGELVASAREAVAGALARGGGARREDVVAIGIANQTETFVRL